LRTENPDGSRIKKPPLFSIRNPRTNGNDIGSFSLVFTLPATRQAAAHLGRTFWRRSHDAE